MIFDAAELLMGGGLGMRRLGNAAAVTTEAVGKSMSHSAREPPGRFRPAARGRRKTNIRRLSRGMGLPLRPSAPTAHLARARGG